MKRKVLNIVLYSFLGVLIASSIGLAVFFLTKQNEQPPHEHSYVWRVVEQATCQHEGLMEGLCDCGDKTTKILEQTDHNFIWVDDPPATCLHDGKRMQKCTYCQETKNVTTLQRTEHKWDEGIIEQDSDCVTPGSKLCTCEYCRSQQTFVIEPKGHLIDKNKWDIDQEPTESEYGWKSHHCQRPGCQYKSEQTRIDKLEPETEVTYHITLSKTNGDRLPSTPTIIVKDSNGLEKGSTQAFEYTITLPANQTFYVSVSDLPEGYRPAEKYNLLPSEPDVNIKIPASPIEFKDETHGRYYIGSVIVDDPFKALETNSANDYETSFGKLLKRYKGIFVNTYFRNCPACNFELPAFIAAYNSTSRYGEKYSDEIAVVMINNYYNGDTTQTIRNMKISEGIPMIMADHNVWLFAHFATLAEKGSPTSIWIDCEGVVVGSVTSALSQYSFTSYFDLLLDRYYQIKGTQRPSEKNQNTIRAIDVCFIDEKKRRVV